VSMRRHTRQWLAAGAAVLVVVAMGVADSVTLSKAKPSFDNETRAINRLLQSGPSTTTTTTTTSPAPGSGPPTTGRH
jgi:hypothetical protein